MAPHALTGGAELNPAMLHIGAGNVYLDHIHRGFRELFRHLGVFLGVFPAILAITTVSCSLSQGRPRSIKIIHAWILQADGV